MHIYMHIGLLIVRTVKPLYINLSKSIYICTYMYYIHIGLLIAYKVKPL